MLWLLLSLSVLAIPALPLAIHRIGRAGLFMGVVPTGVAAIWAATDADGASASAPWVPGLDLSLTFSVQPVGRLMTVLVGTIGALVFVYAHGYFTDSSKHLGRFGATLMAFTASMFGLVWSDSVWTLFVFWELTSITSFLLVGFANTDPAARRAARRALVITVAGGLALLAGFVVLVDATGTAQLSEMASRFDDVRRPDGTAMSVAAVLIIVAAATKSAQVPFHVWLPGAMAAPTPVSAFLHSATMVKAGVLVMALTSPVIADAAWWKPLGLTVGAASMLWGAIGALRHRDAKLILAWGTVSQLGLMVSLLALGTAKATFAAVSMLFAHAIFKAALFMVVGEIDVRTGTRDIGKLHGLSRSMPVAFAIAMVSGLSMAGAPPLLGFAAKEAAIEAVLKLDGTERLLVAAIVVGGSVLTVAYTVRFLLCTFGSFGAPGVSNAVATTVKASRPTMMLPAATLAMASVVGFVGLGSINAMVRPAAIQLDPGAEVYELLRWPGATPGLAVSAVIVAVGSFVGLLAARTTSSAPRPVGADRVDSGLDAVIVIAGRLTGRVQHGSLPVYVATMAGVAALATVPFLWAIDLGALRWWDRPVQGLLAAAVITTGAGTLFVTSRLGAALALGSVGTAVTALFVVHGAPDLALTQLLVETVIVVGFVVGLGHLERDFPPVDHVWKTTRIVVAGLVGLGVAAALAATASAPSGRPPTADLVTASVDEGGGNNVVNVILTDLRALDTVGEVVVLAVVAVGVLSLARAGRTDDPDSPDQIGVST